MVIDIRRNGEENEVVDNTHTQLCSSENKLYKSDDIEKRKVTVVIQASCFGSPAQRVRQNEKLGLTVIKEVEISKQCNLLGSIEFVSIILNFHFPHGVQNTWYYITLEWLLKKEVIETLVKKFHILNLTVVNYLFFQCIENILFIAELNNKINFINHFIFSIVN